MLHGAYVTTGGPRSFDCEMYDVSALSESIVGVGVVRLEEMRHDVGVLLILQCTGVVDGHRARTSV